jgi:uncharacterized membrane protein
MPNLYLTIRILHIVSATLMRIWTALGIPAFLLTLVLHGLMVFRTGMS